MKRALISVALSLMMTLPVAAGIARLPGVYEWLDSGAGYDFFEPVFIALGSSTGEYDTDVIVAMLLVAGFFLSLALIIACWAIVSHLHRAYRR
ncbi:hypothetical protein GXB81_28210 [Paraburkholderia sp. Ac-20336]|uniref:hypothetical protein n=1 Tax=unclassified Paraburkholderia TaxID=2615204 RepID=UPI00197CF850|nr:MULTISPECIES: hypothetical protein [unclassified Paraburkholderia]MBN3806903.1 hypothetical protein [Paraburkholderia sp. Ac-20336]MBN3849233.1 hypothetical protein [Paraburkholderia sp. Ac-20342]